jgi:hypothetical protein
MAAGTERSHRGATVTTTGLEQQHLWHAAEQLLQARGSRQLAASQGGDSSSASWKKDDALSRCACLRLSRCCCRSLCSAVTKAQIRCSVAKTEDPSRMRDDL